MEYGASPLMLRRRLGTELREARLNSDLTQEQVAEAMEWSLSKINRIEQAKSAISIIDLKALFLIYDITDEKQTAKLLALARAVAGAKGGRRDKWWGGYNEVAPATLLELLDYESASSAISQFEPAVVPGILQTEEYASAVLRVFYDEKSSDALVDLRTRHRSLLTSEDGRMFSFILDESVIRRLVGSPSIMRQQLQELLRTAKLPNVIIRVVPFTAGLNPGMKQPFELIQFADTPDESIVFLESPLGDIITDDSTETQYYQEAFRRITMASLSPEDSVEMLRKVASEMT